MTLCPGPGRSDECEDFLCRRNGCFGRPPEPVRIVLAPAEYDAFVALIDNPPAPNEALRKLLIEPAPWDEPRDDPPDIEAVASA